MEHCIHEDKWGMVESTVIRLDKDINGNGKKGLRDTVTELNANTEYLSSNVKDLATSVNALIKFQTAITAEKDEARRKTVLIVTLIGIIFTAINVITAVASRRPEHEDFVNQKPPIYMRDGSVIDSVDSAYFQ